MFTTRPQNHHADALAEDFAAIARIEASLTRGAQRPAAQVVPDFSRLKRYVPDLKM